MHVHLRNGGFQELDRGEGDGLPQVVNEVRAIGLRPRSNGQRAHVTRGESFLDSAAHAMGVSRPPVVETGGPYQQEGEQLDDGRDRVAREPAGRGTTCPLAGAPV